MSSNPPPGNLPGKSTFKQTSVDDNATSGASICVAASSETSEPNPRPLSSNAPPPGAPFHTNLRIMHLSRMAPPSQPQFGGSQPSKRPSGVPQSDVPPPAMPQPIMPPPSNQHYNMFQPNVPQASMPPPENLLYSQPFIENVPSKQVNSAMDPPVMLPPMQDLFSRSSEMSCGPPYIVQSIEPESGVPPIGSIYGYAKQSTTGPNPQISTSQLRHGEFHAQNSAHDEVHPEMAFVKDPLEESIAESAHTRSVPEVTFTGGLVANKMPPFRDPFPPPKQRDAQHLSFLDTDLRPPAPPEVTFYFPERKTLCELKIFWDRFFTWVLFDSYNNFKVSWQEGNVDRHQVSIGSKYPNQRHTACVMIGLVCEPGDEDAAEIAAIEAWPNEWKDNQFPGKSCYFFVASERLVFYIYSKIDGSYRSWDERKSQVSCPRVDYIAFQYLHFLSFHSLLYQYMGAPHIVRSIYQRLWPTSILTLAARSARIDPNCDRGFVLSWNMAHFVRS